MLVALVESSDINRAAFFHLFFFPAIYLTYFAQYFAQIYTYKRIFLVYFQLLSMHDYCANVIHNLATALLEYLHPLAVFPEAHVNFVTILVEHLHLCNAK